MASYTYDPAKLGEYGVDRMRFELGDTCVDLQELSCALCDEEYSAAIEESRTTAANWRQAKLLCLRAIVMKLSYEVDTSVSGLSYELSQRFDRWKAMLEEEEKRVAALTAVPSARAEALACPGRPPYFYAGMHANRRGF